MERMEIMNFSSLDEDDFGALCVCALRYCQGRRTYMPSLIQGVVIGNIDKITDKDLYVMIQDCKSMENNEWLYGDRMDKKNWLNFRDELHKEREKRRLNEES